jgi:hypothetical protein
MCLPEDHFLLIFYKRPVDRAPSFLKFSELAPSAASSYACMGPALCAPGVRRTLSGLTYALLRVNRLRTLHSDLRLSGPYGFYRMIYLLTDITKIEHSYVPNLVILHTIYKL